MDMNIEQEIRDDLRQYLEGRQEIDSRMPECPDLEQTWTSVGEDYMPDGIREFANYPTVSLGWIMFVGMAMAYYWDTAWDTYGHEAHIYPTLRDQRGYDHMDDYIMGEVLQLSEADRTATRQLVAECASRTYSRLGHAGLQPGSCDAFRGYIACLHQLYLMGIAVQLRRMGYHMTQLN